MPTDRKIVNIFLNSLLSKTRLRDNLALYLSDKIDETLAGILSGQAGVLDADQITLAGADPNAFSVDVSNAPRVAVGGGQVLTLTNGVLGVTDNIPFENSNGVQYQVAYKYAQVEDDVTLNPRPPGLPEYQTLLDTIGETGHPDVAPAPVVTGPGTGNNLRLYVDDLCEAGVTHAGRMARVWLSPRPTGSLGPQSSDPAVAFLDLLVQYDGTNNYVDIPYSLANPPLGQDVSANPPSTDRLDYYVLIKGPTVRRNTDLRIDNDYAFIGIIDGNDTGGGVVPVTFVLDDQKSIFVISLDKAYDGVGDGQGRTITVDRVNVGDDGAIVIRCHPGAGLDKIRPEVNGLSGLKFAAFNGFTFNAFDPVGRVVDVHRLSDDFQLRLLDQSIPGRELDARVYAYSENEGVGGACNVLLHQGSASPYFPGWSGVSRWVVGDTILDKVEAELCAMRVKQTRPCAYLRFAVSDLNDADFDFGYTSQGGASFFSIRVNQGVVVGRYQNATFGLFTTAQLGAVLTPDTPYEAYLFATDANKVAFWITGMATPVEIPNTGESFDTLADLNGAWQGQIKLEAKAGSQGMSVYIDYYEFWQLGSMLGNR